MISKKNIKTNSIFLQRMVASSREINCYFMRTSKGIKGTARHFGLQYSYVGALINRYKKQKGIR